MTVTFLRNHTPNIAAMDLFVVPTIGFDPLYVLVIIRLARRELVWIDATCTTQDYWSLVDHAASIDHGYCVGSNRVSALTGR